MSPSVDPKSSRGNATAGGAAARKAPPKPGRGAAARGYGHSLLIAVFLALFFRQFVLQAFRIPSASMENTLLVGDFLFVNKFLYGAEIPFVKKRLPAIRPPRPGDIIVFKPPMENRDFIKRCVAVAGDTVEMRYKNLYVNGRRPNEPYIHHAQRDTLALGASSRDFFGPYVVPKGHLFMMGDNRDNSADSRFWGPEPIERIKGKAMFIYFSVDTAKGYFPPHLRLRRFFRLIH
jgi:signal peptidase I